MPHLRPCPLPRASHSYIPVQPYITDLIARRQRFPEPLSKPFNITSLIIMPLIPIALGLSIVLIKVATLTVIGFWFIGDRY